MSVGLPDLQRLGVRSDDSCSSSVVVVVDMPRFLHLVILKYFAVRA
jgi:hypothetical protein